MPIQDDDKEYGPVVDVDDKQLPDVPTDVAFEEMDIKQRTNIIVWTVILSIVSIGAIATALVCIAYTLSIITFVVPHGGTLAIVSVLSPAVCGITFFIAAGLNDKAVWNYQDVAISVCNHIAFLIAIGAGFTSSLLVLIWWPHRDESSMGTGSDVSPVPILFFVLYVYLVVVEIGFGYPIVGCQMTTSRMKVILGNFR